MDGLDRNGFGFADSMPYEDLIHGRQPIQNKSITIDHNRMNQRLFTPKQVDHRRP